METSVSKLSIKD